MIFSPDAHMVDKIVEERGLSREEAYRLGMEYALALGVPLMVGLSVLRAGKTPADVKYADSDSIIFKREGDGS